MFDNFYSSNLLIKTKNLKSLRLRVFQGVIENLPFEKKI